MASNGSGKHTATDHHSARPLRLAVGKDTPAPTRIDATWQPNLNDLRFSDAIHVDAQRETLLAERQAFIAQGYDVERAKQRLQAITRINPNREYHEELAKADDNLVTLAEMITAIDDQLAALNA